MRLVYVSPEVWPYSRVGGLAEVAHDLPLALGQMGHQVEVVSPKPRLDSDLAGQLAPDGPVLEVPVSWRSLQAKVYTQALSPNVNLNLIENDSLFNRDGLYGNAFGDYEDNAERFIFFCRAVLELVKAWGWGLDVIHVNDWTTGLIPVYLKTLYADLPGLKDTGSLITIHNLSKQGSFWHYDMPLTGLGWELFTPEGVEFFGKINFMKAGIMFADMISTVSQGYAKEILTPQMGAGLEKVLTLRQERLGWVTNGVDYEAWSPETDPLLIRNYSAADTAGKAACQEELRKIFNLDGDSRRPVLAFLGRLVDRRGMGILLPILERLTGLGYDLVIEGWGEDRYHHKLRQIAEDLRGRLGVKIGYDWSLAHKVVAGADMLVMPSQFEPCGLHQMHAMRYGAVPVVRATGGLEDTVSDHGPGGRGTGFKFNEFSEDALLGALTRAHEVFQDQSAWQGIMKRAMARDFSWQSAAQRYEELYQMAKSNRVQGK